MISKITQLTLKLEHLLATGQVGDAIMSTHDELKSMIDKSSPEEYARFDKLRVDSGNYYADERFSLSNNMVYFVKTAPQNHGLIELRTI